jgi:hypothetical protein
VELYFCAGDNRRFAEIAIEAGLLYGARLPTRVHFPIQFADQDWSQPDKDGYIKALKQYKPRVATILDWERPEQRREVFEWAETVASIVDVLILIPKWFGAAREIPSTIGGKEIRIGIPCGPYQSAAALPLEIAGRPVHVLGGQPHRQMDLAGYLNVVSVDCSVTAYMARLKCAFWQNRRWIQLKAIGLGNLGKGALYEAFSRSCANVIAGWQSFESSLQ